MKPTVIYHNNSHVIELIGLEDAISGTRISSASVTATIYDNNGNALSGETWPITLTAVADDPGRYRGTVSGDLSTSGLRRGTITVTVDDPSYGKAEFSEQVEFVTRRFDD